MSKKVNDKTASKLKNRRQSDNDESYSSELVDKIIKREAKVLKELSKYWFYSAFSRDYIPEQKPIIIESLPRCQMK